MMKNKLRFFIATIVLMMINIFYVNAVVIFDAKVDKGVYNEQTGMYDVTKNGITISVSATECEAIMPYNNEDPYTLDAYTIESNCTMKIVSNSSNVTFVAFMHFGLEFIDEKDGVYTHVVIKDNNQGKFVSSTCGKYDCYSHCGHTSYADYEIINYGVWTGNSSSFSLISGSDVIYLSKIVIYENDDVLPQRKIYADYFCDGNSSDLVKKATFIYGYKEFASNVVFLYSDDYWSIENVNLGEVYDGYEPATYTHAIAIDFDPSFAEYIPNSTRGWFSNCYAISIDGLEYLNTSEVSDMSSMFEYMERLQELDVSNFDTSNVTNMKDMFFVCRGLTSIDVSNFNTSNVTNMSDMFAECENLESLDVSNFETSKVIGMGGMFAGCSNLTTLDVSFFNTSNVTGMSYMFYGCSGLTSLDVSNFDTSKLKKGSSNWMFANCSSLKEIAISATMSNLDENAFEGVGTPENPCEIYAPVGFDFGTDTSQPHFYWKGGCFKAKVETFAALSDDGKTLTFYNGIKPQNMIDNVYAFNTADTNPAWYSQRANITKVVFDPSFAYFKPTSTYGWFRGMENLEEIEGLEYLNTSETTLMSYMFYGCSKLKSIDVSHFDTKNVEKMGYMFQNCTSLENIDISNFDYTSNTSCYRMFNGCTNLKSINTGEWKNNINDQFGYLFSGCSSLETLDLSQLNLPSNAKTTSMLNGCSALHQLTISPSMNVLNSAACSGVGTANNPCDITAPDDFDYGVDTSVEPFRWKSGYFRLASKLFAEASDVKYGNVYDLNISLRNGSHVYNGYQFNVHLPVGFDLTQKPRTGYEYTLSNRYTNTPTIRITPQDDGSYQILAYAMDDVTITGTESLIITLPLNVEEGLAEGNYSGTITDITFNNPDNTSAYLQDVAFDIFVPAFGMGDVNHDRSVNITDVMMTVNHVVGQTPAGFHVEDADVNGDGVVNISDIMAIVNLVLNAPTANAPANNREAMTDAISLTPNAQGYAVTLKNNESYTALQMDIQMLNDEPLNVRLSDNRFDGHTVVCNDLGGGHYRIAIYSLNGNVLNGNDGILLQLQTNTKHYAQPEIYDVQLTNRLFESITLSGISFPTDITNVGTDENTDAPAYNVQGIRATKHHRGILIKDGWKQVHK